MTEYDRHNKKVITWASNYLSSHGYTLISTLPEKVQETPWSYVERFATTAGYIYLKHTPKLLALEADIIRIFRDQFQASVPTVIAQHDQWKCFLMQDAGNSLRGILKQQFDEALLCNAINQFTSLQLAVADRVSVFLDIGVPDWRLDKFPDLYQELIAQKELLLADGLSEIELSELQLLLPYISNLCTQLAAYDIKQSFVQPDFNDNNTLIAATSQQLTFIDLGEIVISHPFFSLINGLQQIKKHHALTDEDASYLRIRDTCLKNYRIYKSQQDLLDVLAMAQQLFPVYSAFAGYRLMIACGKSKFTDVFRWQARPSIQLKEFIKNVFPRTRE